MKSFSKFGSFKPWSCSIRLISEELFGRVTFSKNVTFANQSEIRSVIRQVARLLDYLDIRDEEVDLTADLTGDASKMKITKSDGEILHTLLKSNSG